MTDERDHIGDLRDELDIELQNYQRAVVAFWVLVATGTATLSLALIALVTTQKLAADDLRGVTRYATDWPELATP